MNDDEKNFVSNSKLKKIEEAAKKNEGAKYVEKDAIPSSKQAEVEWEEKTFKVEFQQIEMEIKRKQRDLMVRCARWMRITIGIAAALLGFLYGYVVLGLMGFFHLNTSLVQHGHLLIFLISILSVYCFIAPYLLLKGIIAPKEPHLSPTADLARGSIHTAFPDSQRSGHL